MKMSFFNHLIDSVTLCEGVPAVGVRAGGLVDIIEDGITGFLVPDEDDMHEFYQRVRELIDDKSLRVRMGQNARRSALTWSWEVASEHLRTVQYSKAINFHFSRNLHDKNYAQDLCQTVSDQSYN